MEEIIHQLKDYLSHIAWTQNQIDDLRVQLQAHSDASELLFKKISGKGDHLSFKDICDFCIGQGYQIGEGSEETLQAYFKLPDTCLNFEQFSSILSPKNNSHWVPIEEESQNPPSLFCSLIACVLESSKELESRKCCLWSNMEQIKAYFLEKYLAKDGFNREVLVKFMEDQGIYSKPGAEQIGNYIYSQGRNFVTWEDFLMEKDMPGGGCSQVIKKNEKKQPKTEIDKVMSQIDEIQKTLQEKRKNKNRSVSEEPLMLSENSKFATQDHCRSKVVGKVVSRAQDSPALHPNETNSNKKINFEVDEPFTRTAQSKFQDTGKQSNKKWAERVGLKEMIYQTHKPNYTLHEGISRPFYESVVKNCSRKKGLGKSASEAHLKIREIEKKALDKFLTKRFHDHLPSDHYTPYYYSNQSYRRENLFPSFDYSKTSLRNSPSSSRVQSRVAYQSPAYFDIKRFSEGIYDFIQPSTRISRPLRY